MTRTEKPSRPRPGDRREPQSRGLERRAAIIAAATKRIVDDGLEGLRVRDVATDVGINPATLHHHFPTKEDLIAAVIGHFSEMFAQAQPKICRTIKAVAPLAAITGHLRAVADQLARAPEMFVVMNELMVRANHDDRVAELLQPSQASWREHIRMLLSTQGVSDHAVLGQNALPDLVMTFLSGLSLRLSAVGPQSAYGEQARAQKIAQEIVLFEKMLETLASDGCLATNPTKRTVQPVSDA